MKRHYFISSIGAGRKLTGLVVETTAVQMIASMAVLIIPALAPEIAPDLGQPAGRVGFQVGLLYLAGTISSLFAGNAVRRFGACRTEQICMVLIALGCLFAMVPRLVALVAGSILIGIAYGLPNPAASHLLVRHTSAARRNLIFSIKQTGVPLGGMAAGLVGPPVALAFGWMAALLVVAIAALALAAITQAGRSEWDNDRVPAAPLFRLPRQGLRALWRNPVLPWLAWSSFCFSAVQLCLMSFLTVLLVEEQKLNLVTAGTVLATTQAAGAAGRILWGAVADRVGDGLAVLLGLASFMVIWSAAVTLLAPGTPLLLTGAVFVLLGLTAVGWNGVFLAEVAKLAPPSEVGAFTGGAMFITYIGVMVGPTAMSVVHDRVGSYRASYWMMAGLAALGGVLILSARRRLARIRAGENA